jgi:soluble lytic murein transglycosylase-like protein
MAYGISNQLQQAEEASKLSIEELMRLQSMDPSFVYTIALQEKQKQEAAAANQAALGTETDPNTLMSQMEQDLASRRAPGVQIAGGRSMPQPQGMPQGMPQAQPRPMPQAQPQVRGIASAPAPNMQAIGRARGGIIGYMDGGDVDGQTVQEQDPMQAQLEAFMKLQDAYNKLRASGAPQETLDRIQSELNSYNNVNQGGYNIEVEAAKARGEYGSPDGMAMGGVVGYKKGGPVDMDALLDALMIAESGGDPKAVSRAGAEGAYQIMPATAADPGFGVSPMEGDRFDPKASRAFARQYLQAMLDRYDGDVEAALIAYNAGAGNADKFMAAGRDYDVLPQTMQTQPYVSKIMGQVEREDRRRDFQMGGGRTISTTAPESYTERQRRETKERADRALASRFATVPEETKSELYEPNIEDAASVADAMSDLLGGQWDGTPMNMGERDPRFSDPANYLRDMGAEQEDDNKTRFAQAFPRAEKAVSDYAADKELGGLGSLRTMGRLQESRRNAFSEAFPEARASVERYEQEEADGGIGYLRRLARMQAEAEERRATEEAGGLRYLINQARMQNQLEDIDPASNVKNFNEGGFLSNLQQKVYDATKGFMPDPGELIGGQLDAAEEDPLNYAANATLALYGGPALIRGGATLLGPIIKKFGTKYGPAVLQRARDLAMKTVTKPNPAKQNYENILPGSFPIKPFKGPARQFSPGRTAATSALGAKAIDAYMGGEETEEAAALTEADIFRRDAPAGFVRAIDANEGEQAALRDMFPDAPEMTAQQRTDERARVARGGGDRPAQRSAGLSGLLEQAKPYASTAASIAQILGRGAGASKGFEGAKFVEESARLRAAEQARQDRKEALDAELGVRREQISATKAAAEAAAGARLSQAQAKIVADYMGGIQFGLDVKALAEKQGKSPDDPSVAQAAVRAFLNRLGQIQDSVGGMGGLETQQGLSAEQKASLQAFLAS